MDYDVSKTHLGWRRFESEFVGGERFSSRYQVLCLFLGVVAKRISDRVCLLRSDDSRQKYEGRENRVVNPDLHAKDSSLGRTPILLGESGDVQHCGGVGEVLSPPRIGLRRTRGDG